MGPAAIGLLFILLRFNCASADIWDGLDWVEEQVDGVLAGLSEDESSEEKPTLPTDLDAGKKLQQNMDGCHKKCSAQHPPQSTGWGPCLSGCVYMEKHLTRLTQKYSKTRPEYLAGNAMDSCWSECDAAQSGSLAADCKAGCENMRALIKGNQESSESASDEKETNIRPDLHHKSGVESKAKSAADLEAGIQNHPVHKENSVASNNFMDSKPAIHDNKDNKVASTDNHKEGSVANKEDNGGSISNSDATSVAGDQDTLYIWVDNVTLLRYLQLKRLIGWMSEMNNVVQQSIQDRPVDSGSSTGEDGYMSWIQYNEPVATNEQASSNKESFLSRAKESLENVKERIQSNLGSYRWDDFILIIIVGLSIGILVSSLLECIFCKKKRTEIKATDDYYTLKGEPYNPVLPTYEECVKMDKHYFASLHTPGEITKTSLNNLPVIWVEKTKEIA